MSNNLKFLRSKNFRIIRFIAVTILWLGVMLAFYRKEVGPAFQDQRGALTYLQLSSAYMAREEWMGIFFEGRQLGYSHTSLYPHQGKGFYGTALESTIWLELPLLGRKSRLEAHSYCLISSGGKIHRLNFLAESTKPPLQLRGETEGGNLVITIKAKEVEKEYSLPLPRESLPLFSLTSLLAFRPLKKGEVFKLPALDVLKSFTSEKLQTGTIRFEVVNKNEEGYRLLAFYEGMTMEIWMDPDGNVTRLLTPIGWEFVKQEHEEVLGFIRNLRYKTD